MEKEELNICKKGLKNWNSYGIIATAENFEFTRLGAVAGFCRPIGALEREGEIMTLALTIVQFIAAVAIILMVLFQSGKSAGLSSVIAGSSDTFMAKNRSRALDARLAKATKWVAIVFVILTVVLNILA